MFVLDILFLIQRSLHHRERYKRLTLKIGTIAYGNKCNVAKLRVKIKILFIILVRILFACKIHD